MLPTRRNRRAIAPVAIALVALATVPGCGRFGDDEDDAVPATTTTTTIPEPETELLDPGAAPRETLRFAFEPGEITVLVVTDLDLTQQQDGDPVVVDLPPIRQTVRLTTAAPVGGIADVTLEIEDVALEADDTLPDEDRAAVTEQLDQLVGLTGQGRVDDQGRVVAFDYTPPAGVDDRLRALVDGFADQLDGMVAPLPDEPVGVGARWRSTTATDAGGIAVPITTVYELTANEGS